MIRESSIPGQMGSCENRGMTDVIFRRWESQLKLAHETQQWLSIFIISFLRITLFDCLCGAISIKVRQRIFNVTTNHQHDHHHYRHQHHQHCGLCDCDGCCGVVCRLCLVLCYFAYDRSPMRVR